MSNTALINFPSAGDKTLAQFLKAQAVELGDVHKDLLNEIARAVAERGWVQARDALLRKLVDREGLDRTKVTDAIDELIRRRLIMFDDSGQRITGFLGNISLGHTPHRAHLEGGIDIFVFGAMELLTLNSTLLKPVDAFTRCPVTDKKLRLRIVDEAIVDASPSGISGFVAEWDGVAPLAAVAAHSPLFADDEAMERWVSQHGDVKGTELPGDLLLWVGMEAAKQLGGLRFKLIGHS